MNYSEIVELDADTVFQYIRGIPPCLIHSDALAFFSCHGPKRRAMNVQCHAMVAL